MPTAGQVNWAKFRVAAVAVAALAILIELAYLLAGGTLFQPRVTLYLYIPDATGLVPNAPVRVDGIYVGKVSSVELSGSNDPARAIKVSIAAESNRLSQIPADSLAEINPDSLVGDMYVDVTSGRSPRHIPPNGEIPFKPQTELLKSLDLTQFDKQLRGIDATLAEIEEGRTRVGQFVVGEAVYDDLMKRITEAESGFRAAISVTTGIGKLIHTDDLYRSISDPLVELDRSLARLQAARTGVGGFLNDPAQFNQLRQAIADVRTSIAGIRAGDFVSSDALYAAWNGQAQALIRKVDDFNASPAMLTSAWYEQLDGAARELRDSVKDFRDDPAKFLRVKVF